jgi:hypothetical protein
LPALLTIDPPRFASASAVSFAANAVAATFASFAAFAASAVFFVSAAAVVFLVLLRLPFQQPLPL